MGGILNISSQKKDSASERTKTDSSNNSFNQSNSRIGRSSQNRRARPKKPRRLFCCCGGCVGVLFLVFVVGILGLWVLGRGYNNWYANNKDFLSEVATDMNANKEVADNLDDKLERFRETEVQKETLDLSCEEMDIIIKRVIKDHWQDVDVQQTGVVCSERNLDVYVQLKGNIWLIFNIWQRANGKVEFLIYDVKVGGYSLGQLSLGYVTQDFNRGIHDALDFLDNSELMGREIVEIYVDSGGVQIVGEK
jgi:hypothetical protein